MSASEQHTLSKTPFWMRADSHPISLHMIASMQDEDCRRMLAVLRWGDQHTQTCPACGTIDSHYNIKSRRQWRCKSKGCGHTFSVLSGTPFENAKMGYRRLLMAMFTFIVNQKGISALALSRIIGGQYRTSYTFMHKIREVFIRELDSDTFAQLSGTVEIDGAHLSGRLRKPRKAKKVTAKDKTEVPKKWRIKSAEAPAGQHRDKVDPSENPTHPNRRIVLVLRLKDTSGKKRGASRTITMVVPSENKEDINRIVKKFVAPGSTIRTDELPGYKHLVGEGYIHESVNHSEEFSTDDGVNQNQAESYFARMRRAIIGQYHRVTPKYMHDYAQEIAWREDVRRRNTLMQLKLLGNKVLSSGVSVDWFNYGRKGFGRTAVVI